jgi:hypothetical protein
MWALDFAPWTRVLHTNVLCPPEWRRLRCPPSGDTEQAARDMLSPAELKLTIALNLCDGGLDLSDLPAELLVLLLQAAALEGGYDLLPLAACLISSR